MGSLAGVAPAENLSAGPNGRLIHVGNVEWSAKANAYLIVSPTERDTNMKVWFSERLRPFSGAQI